MFRTFSIEEREEMKRKQLSRENIGFCTVREGRYDEIRCRHHERISRNGIHTHPALSNYVLFSFNFAIRGKPVVLVSHFFFFKKTYERSRSGRVGSGQVGGDGGRPVCHTGPYYNLQIPNTPSMVLFLELGLQVIILPMITLDFIQGAPGCEEEK